LVVKLFLVTTLVVPGGQGLLQGQMLDDVKASYTQTLDRRQELVTQLHQHEESYRTLLRQVDVLKSGPNTLQNRLELEGLLRDSRQLAQRMQTLQKKIQAADTRLDNQRSQLVAAIDSRTEVLEKKLAKTAASERGTIVGELNELRADRQRFSEPLPSAPTDGEVSETLAMLDELDGASAEDLLAAADELQDTEDQVRKRLQAIEGRIKQLREAKMLARRAQTFATEESFFDETDRSRFIATYGDSATAGDRSGDGANEAPTVGDDSGGARDGHGEAGDEAESPQPGAGMDPSTDGDFNAGAGDDSDSLSDSPEAPPAAPEEPGDSTGGDSQDGDVFGAGDDLLIDGQTDPETSVGSGFESDYELNSRIQQLQREQKRLEEQARELEKKAGQLRKRAKDSLD
jgi:hypothetical protein